MESPRVSVIISTYNRKELLLKAIDSVFKQTYQDFEIIVVDDCSTDGTDKAIKRLNDTREKLSYYRNKENFGSDTYPKNFGVTKARGHYIAFLDDDVTWRPNHLSEIMKVLEENKELDGAYGDMWIMPSDEPGIAHDWDVQFLMLRNYIDASACVFKKRAFFQVGGMDQTLTKFVDWNLWVRMAKLGKKFQRVPVVTFDYLVHEKTKSQRVKTETYQHPQLGTLWVPTFDATGCYINAGYVGEAKEPRVAIFTLHYDRLDYSKDTYKQMRETAGSDFDWFCIDNGSTDGTREWLEEMKSKREIEWLLKFKKNEGISKASNRAISVIMSEEYDVVIKIDNDVDFQTNNWLSDFVDMWKRNRKLYLSPYVEGLYHHPGGSQRRGFGFIGEEFIEVTNHIGGIFAFADASAYSDFRWNDEKLHGDQDTEASFEFRKIGFMPCYYPKHRICHKDGTLGQHKKYSAYFERRKTEKKAQ